MEVLVYPTFLKWLPNSIGVSTYPTKVGGGVEATMGLAQGGLAAAGEREHKRKMVNNMLRAMSQHLKAKVTVY